jgi:hypothetical protein
MFGISSGAEQLPTFTDISISSGIKIFRTTYGNPIWYDFDRDGKLDVFVINHTAPPSLWHNNGDATFTDYRPLTGIPPEGDRHGAAWGDYDNDGDMDLFITLGAERGNTVGGKIDQLYRNDGGGAFTDVTTTAGVRNAAGRGRSVNWVDFNNDGKLDLFLKNSKTANALYRNNGDGTFTEVASSAGLADAPGEVSAWADYDGDGYMDLFITSAAKDQLWKNHGDGTFTQVTAQAGLKNLDRGQGIAWGDYNNDGHSDLFVARGYHDVNDSLLWDGSTIVFSDLEDVETSGLDFTSAGDQVTLDLYVDHCRQPEQVFFGGQRLSPTTLPVTLTNHAASGQPAFTPGQDHGFFIWKDGNGWHLRWVANGSTTYMYGKLTSNGQFMSVQPVNFTRRTPSIESTLYRNNGDGTFTDVTKAAGLGSTKNNRAAIWGDFDNDGYLDLYLVNSGSIQQNGANALFRNKGDGTFENVTSAAQVWAGVNGRGDGAAWGDFDNNGFLDLFLTNGWGLPILGRQGQHACLVSGPHLFYRNQGNGNRWLKITLKGTQSNRDGIGAKVLLQASGLMQLREVNGGGGGQYFSQGGGPLHFGLGQVNKVDALVIQWPSGRAQSLSNLSPNQEITVVEESVAP